MPFLTFVWYSYCFDKVREIVIPYLERSGKRQGILLQKTCRNPVVDHIMHLAVCPFVSYRFLSVDSKGADCGGRPELVSPFPRTEVTVVCRFSV